MLASVIGGTGFPWQRASRFRRRMQMTQSTTLEPMLRKISYLYPLEKDDADAVLALPHRVQKVERNHYLVREREKATQCCLMLAVA
jgi:hypothetical protein